MAGRHCPLLAAVSSPWQSLSFPLLGINGLKTQANSLPINCHSQVSGELLAHSFHRLQVKQAVAHIPLKGTFLLHASVARATDFLIARSNT